MANVLFGSPVWSDVGTTAGHQQTPTLSGGSWLAALPLTNVQSRKLHRPARSTTDAVADSQFTIDLGTDRAVRCLAALTNISTVGTIRGRGFTTVPILDALDFSTGWTAAGTVTRTAAAYDGSGADGVPLDLVIDNDGAVAEAYFRAVTFTGDGTKYVSIRLKADTATATAIGIWDSTASAWRHRINVAWSGGVPTATSGAGSGTITTTSLGDGVYRFGFTVPSVVAANVNNLYCYATAFSAAATGNTYIGDALAWNAATDQLVYDTGCELAIPSGLDAEESEGLNVWWSHIPSAAQTARYWRVNINDTTNADTFIDVYRLMITGGYQPSVNMVMGAGIAFDTRGSSEETVGGAEVYDARRVRRIAMGSLEQMPEDEAFDEWFRLKMRHGKTRQLFFVWDPDDTTYLHRRAFPGTLQELSAIEAPYHGRMASAFKIKEDL